MRAVDGLGSTLIRMCSADPNLRGCMNSKTYFAVVKSGAVQKCFDNHAEPEKALAEAVAYVETRLKWYDYVERDTRDIVIDANGNRVFGWVKEPVVVKIEQLSRDGGPYQSGPVVASWVGGERA